jgi:hypothetical protein
MLRYQLLARSPALLRSFTGLDKAEFDSLYSNVESRHSKFERERLSRGDRERAIGAGRPFALSLRDRLLMLLVYYRLYVSMTLVEFLFEIDQTNVSRNIRILEPLVRQCVPLPEKVYERAKRASTPEEVEEYFPGFKAFIDATEQEIPRPKRKAKRVSHYSGKKKRHTVKTQLTVNSKGAIVHRTNHARGRRNDYAIFKRNRPELPEGVRLGVDLGYNGIQNDFPEMEPMVPFKKRSPGRGHKGVKAKPLTPYQKRFNRELSKARVVVEHTISRMKKFRIMGEEFRNRLKRYDLMTDIVSGLVNLRIMGTRSLGL